MKHRVIIVTDGDNIAKEAVETAARNIGGRSISRSAGNPTPLSGAEMIRCIQQAASDPVVVMVDDCGNPGLGEGELLIRQIAEHPALDLLGVVAVASNTKEEIGVDVDESVTQTAEITDKGVNKEGLPQTDGRVVGDTLSVLQDVNVPIIVGLGDPGKMDFKDKAESGAPITTKALQKILQHSSL